MPDATPDHPPKQASSGPSTTPITLSTRIHKGRQGMAGAGGVRMNLGQDAWAARSSVCSPGQGWDHASC
jgi:hypothetical protein